MARCIINQLVLFLILGGVFVILEQKPDSFSNTKDPIIVKQFKHRVTKLHNHKFLELVYVLDGEAEHTINDEVFHIQKGDYFIIDYHTFHKYQGNIRIVNCLFKPEFIDQTLLSCQNFRDVAEHYLIKSNVGFLKHPPTNYIYHDEKGNVLNLMRQLQNEYRKKKSGYLEIMRSYLIVLIVTIMRKISGSDGGQYSPMIQNILEEIERTYTQDIQLGEISQNLHYSMPYVSKRFKEETGMTYLAYLQKKRISEACRLLANTDKKITEVARLVGYGDVKYFQTLFKRQMGASPKKFQLQHGKKGQ